MGVLNLKFCSSSQRVLLSIPEEHRKAGMKNEDFIGNLPEEQALGVLWKKFSSRTNLEPEGEHYPFQVQCMAHLALEHHFYLEGSRYCKGCVKRTLSGAQNYQKTEWEKWKIKLPALEEMQI